MADENSRSKRAARKCAEVSRIFVKQELRARAKQVSNILKKAKDERTETEKRILDQSPEIVKTALKRANTRKISKERRLEIEDCDSVLEEKCRKMAEAIQKSKNLVIYTGAGISTAASIPDYRGPNGIWTLLEKGIQPKAQDLSDAEPTYAHMAISTLYKQGYVEHMLSQNCDGLHLRSGFPKERLSEVHGNMFLEWCKTCSPHQLYYRLFDVTERTALRKHNTGRKCHRCKGELRDTIIHFGEKGPLCPPYRWHEAVKAVEDADVILCLGSSLKVLRRYHCLWSPHVPACQRPKLYIVNLQWTPKDDAATCKINGKCDIVMEKVMRYLGLDVPQYDRSEDPLFHLATPVLPGEEDIASKKMLLPCANLKPAQDLLHPRHRGKMRTRKRNATRHNMEKPTKMCKPSGNRTIKYTDFKSNDQVKVEYDSDTMDAPETLEILMKNKERNKTEERELKPPETKVQHTQTSSSEIKMETDNKDLSVGQAMQMIISQVMDSSTDIKTEEKKQTVVKDTTISALHDKLKDIKRKKTVEECQTIKHLLTLPSKVTNMNSASPHAVVVAQSNAHSLNVILPSKSMQNAAGLNDTPTVTAALSYPYNQTIGIKSQMHTQLVPSSNTIACSVLSTPSALAAYTPQTKTTISFSVAKPAPSFMHSNPTCTASQGSQSQRQGGIMQSLDVYKSLDEKDFSYLSREHNYAVIANKSSKHSQLMTSVSQVFSSPKNNGNTGQLATKPAAQKTVAELLRERTGSCHTLLSIQKQAVSPTKESQKTDSGCDPYPVALPSQKSIAVHVSSLPVASLSHVQVSQHLKSQTNMVLTQARPAGSVISPPVPTLHHAQHMVYIPYINPVPVQIIPRAISHIVSPVSPQLLPLHGQFASLSPLLGQEHSAAHSSEPPLSSAMQNIQQSVSSKGQVTCKVVSHTTPLLIAAMPHASATTFNVSPSVHSVSTTLGHRPKLQSGNVSLVCSSSFSQMEPNSTSIKNETDYYQKGCMESSESALQNTGDLKPCTDLSGQHIVDHVKEGSIPRNSSTDSLDSATFDSDLENGAKDSPCSEECASPMTSAPGWFGKGFNPRRRKRRKNKYT